MNKNKGKVIVVLGTTSAGKTSLGVRLAYELDGEVVSVDSRQVYRGMDIGTGKDLKEYVVEGKNIKHHLIDIADPKDRFSLASYQKLAFEAIDDILERGKLPILVGGTGQYLEAVVDNYILSEARPNEELRKELELLEVDELYNKILSLNKVFSENINESDRKNKRRLIRYIEVLSASSGHFEPSKRPEELRYDFLILGLIWSKEALSQRIDKRLKERLEEGLVEEVGQLNRDGVSFERLEELGLEYRYVSQYLKDELEYDEMIEKLSRELKKFAKRQMTWYRRWERQGREIRWIGGKGEADELVKEFIK